MAKAMVRSPREALLWAFNDLEENNFKILKFHLRDRSLQEGQCLLARGELESLSRVDLASRLTLIYGHQEAVKVVLKVLTVMGLLELVEQLNHICLNDYREIYREHVRSLEERQEGGDKSSYNQLLLVAKPSSGSPELPACPILEQDLDSVTVESLFDPRENPCKHPPLVVLQGNAGTGKTTLVRKMVLDWASGTLYPGQFDYVFYVSCREVVLFPKGRLEEFIFWCCGNSQAPVSEILRQPERLLFILDGFDELQRPFAKGLQRPTRSSMEAVLHLLIKREILPKSSLLITTRPLALRTLESVLKHPRFVHILGFSEDERRKYISSYFTDEEQARNAFDIVQRNGVLYKACQVPGICWVVCSWLKRQMERGREVSEMPSNDTDIFMAYVSTYLPCSDSAGSSDLTRNKVLKGLCSLAAEGIKHQRFMFNETDLKNHDLDGPSLAPFLYSSDYQEGLELKKLYSFHHIIFQEFFNAVSYLVKEDQQGKESLREVSRLLHDEQQAGNEEMTLSMHFLLDISKRESSSNLELKFCLKISPSIKQDLKHFKEQVESMKHRRTWDLEFSLYNKTLNNLLKGVQMGDISFKMNHSNEKKSKIGNSFYVKTSLRDGQKEEEKYPVVGKGTEKKALSGKRLEDGGESSSRAGRREVDIEEPEGQKNPGVEA
ncbi:NACHT, LRR and PYD domains-containing protein 10 [Sorex fumeus]|uniref:NACHT, LRR and PYD domains-containing protein 10 n=1 Tax=Sorex fumeus TaxID=62283 RepID=UPI0024AD9F5C|nr:NACHT, LRR and PYD domains-containing protein 10 [Sorex fumeus]